MILFFVSRFRWYCSVAVALVYVSFGPSTQTFWCLYREIAHIFDFIIITQTAHKDLKLTPHTYEGQIEETLRITHSHKSLIIKIIIKINIYSSWLLVRCLSVEPLLAAVILAGARQCLLFIFFSCCTLFVALWRVSDFVWDLGSFVFVLFQFCFISVSAMWRCGDVKARCFRIKIKPNSKHQIIIIDHYDFRFIVAFLPPPRPPFRTRL